MALVVPTGFGNVGVELQNEFDPEAWFVTFGVDLDLGANTGVEIATSIGQAFEIAFQDLLSSQVTIANIELAIGQDGGPPILVEAFRGNAGSNTSEMLPQNCAALYRKGTNRGGQPGRGRFYMPGVLREGQVSQVGINSPTETLLLSAAGQQFLDELETPTTVGAASAPMVLLHNTGVPGGTTPDPVVSLSCDARISTQRRRLR